jgi:hypothetical protein
VSADERRGLPVRKHSDGVSGFRSRRAAQGAVAGVAAWLGATQPRGPSRGRLRRVEPEGAATERSAGQRDPDHLLLDRHSTGPPRRFTDWGSVRRALLEEVSKAGQHRQNAGAITKPADVQIDRFWTAATPPGRQGASDVENP